ncbi:MULTISPECIES: MurR/RpiR family transcriptional regulator [Enterococcus]|uniref:RpiR family transcriptional regulator, glv operon transcriptional regulator n=1 Tax=Candidatus Enterococcus mangumiae TaxID=2230878 RepID=A0ABZ2SWJ6_9ENTE|nr:MULTISPECIES: MurR/RpiR family transcriptional regulator [unclassified Enterococcus]MBO0462459.1 MurR/RpiR family transcriptional regulator [Enterococcus sp. DIV1298c]MBO0490693.1 MurR/RpiR family transcriptional regulator [Enterococcus sp. DIV1094]MBO1299316.1 MurR/RpiR family transcriptional regulator [Enterococcus sp. DIV1271a]
MLQDLITTFQSKLTENDFLIWSYITNHKKHSLTMSINELAKKCNVSRTTIMRFCQKLEFDGFSEFKYHLKNELTQENMCLSELEGEILENHIQTIENLKKKDFTDLCKMMANAKRIFIYGSGDIQTLVSSYMKLLFVHNGLILYDFGAVSINKQFYQIIQPDDLVLLLTLNGESPEVVKLAKQLKQRGIQTIGITKLRNSAVSKLCTETIFFLNSELQNPENPIALFESTSTLFFVIEYFLLKYDAWQKQTNQNL